MKNKTAVTLIEVLVATAIFSVVVTALYSVLLISNKSWANFNNNVTIQQNARNALINMTMDFREGHSFFITKESGSIRLSFLHPEFGLVSYTWANHGTSANQILRQAKNETRILANHIYGLSFEHVANTIVINVSSSIQVKSSHPVTYDLKGKVALRSKIQYDSL